MLNKQNILFLDIETAPIIAHVWGLWENNVALNQIVKDWHLLSWSAKWLDAPANQIMYADQRNAKDISDDRAILAKLWDLLNEADVVVAHNGAAFDKKKINARFIINGFAPPSPYRMVDTYQACIRNFGFTSNKLAYVGKALNKKHFKREHHKFAGHELWTACLAGNKDAWLEMEKYNKLDVLALEELYKKLSPWDRTINFNTVVHKSGEHVCHCGSTSFQKRGTRVPVNGKPYTRVVCNECGTWYRHYAHNAKPAKRTDRMVRA